MHVPFERRFAVLPGNAKTAVRRLWLFCSPYFADFKSRVQALPTQLRSRPKRSAALLAIFSVLLLGLMVLMPGSLRAPSLERPVPSESESANPVVAVVEERLATEPSARSERSSEVPLTFEERFITSAAIPAQASQRETKVPASVTIAQAILESDWGRSGLSRNANNYFGIKAMPDPGPAGVVYMDTWEVFGGRNVTVKAPFRAYNNAEESFVDHGKFLADRPLYRAAFKFADDAKQFAREIHKAGYATDPGYSTKLIGLMDRFNLYKYDLK